MNPIDRFVDRVVIRSTCLVEPCASQSWVKMRVVAVAFLATMPGLVMVNQGFDTVGWIVVEKTVCHSAAGKTADERLLMNFDPDEADPFVEAQQSTLATIGGGRFDER